MTRARARSRIGSAAVLTVTAAVLTVLAGGPAAAAAAVPTYRGLLVGPGLADMYPVDVTDSGSYYYVLDAGRYRIAAVNRSTGAIAFQGAGHQGGGTNELSDARAIANDSAGNIYVADTSNNRVQKYDARLNHLMSWGTRGTGLGQFKMTYGIAVGPGKGANGSAQVVYVSDQGNRVQKFTTSGAFISQFGVGILQKPRQIAIHPVTRDVYVLDGYPAFKVVVFSQDGAEKFSFGSAGTGPGQFSGDPRGISIAPNGLVYVTDDGGARVEVFSSSGAYKYQFGGPGTGSSNFTDPRGLTTTSDGKILVTDEWDYSLKEFKAGPPVSFIRRLFGGRAPVPGVNTPRGLDVDASGRVFISDYWNQRIERLNADGSGAIAWGKRGPKTVAGAINFAWDVAVQPGTGRVFLANRESNQIEVFTSSGQYVTRWGRGGTATGTKVPEFAFPQSVAFAPDGTLLVADSDNHRIQRLKIDSAGNPTFVAVYGSFGDGSSSGGHFNIPTGLDVAPDGTIWVADTLNGRVQKRSPGGTWTVYRDLADGSHFKVPWGVTVAPDGAIWVADSGNDRVVKMSNTGVFAFDITGEELGIGPFSSPFEVAFGPSRQIFISDTWNNRVVRLVY